MKKAELINEVVKASGGALNKRDTASVLDAAFGVIGKVIRDEKRLVLPGFGTFTVKERPERQGRNPRTGKRMVIKASSTVSFKPAPSLKQGL